MKNVEIFTDELNGEVYIIITNDDGSKVSMLKSTYDEQQAKTL